MSRKKWTNQKLYSRLINNKTERTYWDNISELRRRPCVDVYEKATLLARSKNNKEKIIGIDVLAQLGFNPRFKQEETIKLYFDLIETKPNGKVLSSILYGISHNNENLTKEQVEKLSVFKYSTNADVRKALVNSLCGLEYDIAINTLIHLSKDKVVSVRDWATFGLGSQIEINNKTIIDALWDRINDSDQNSRFEAIVGLANRNDKRVKEIIIKELNRREYGTLLFEAIETLNDLDFLPYLERSLVFVQNTNDEIQKGWLLAIEGTIEKIKARNL
ncbi:hypothetical protein [Tenacibaculum sp. M341]|uniref:hypothetical protein n=1 Tax=Tenacibaculum sp. M341 TaxID=2530339 RepID=UPI0010502640|nr:hypothetical protein [Tenacibaculum sp. M341]TCI84801.1 hypothetical protein EYW44_19455 [Tenacibaculum sp. M341]